jgi:hypothetical protein
LASLSHGGDSEPDAAATWSSDSQAEESRRAPSGPAKPRRPGPTSVALAGQQQARGKPRRTGGGGKSRVMYRRAVTLRPGPGLWPGLALAAAVTIAMQSLRLPGCNELALPMNHPQAAPPPARAPGRGDGQFELDTCPIRHESARQNITEHRCQSISFLVRNMLCEIWSRLGSPPV